MTILTVVTGKKIEDYRLELLGEVEVQVPAGVFHTLHVRAPGDNSTELWLAVKHFMLPVKIQHSDRAGDGFVEVATRLDLGGAQ